MKNITKYSIFMALILALTACGGISRSVTDTDTRNKSNPITFNEVDNIITSREQIINTPKNASISFTTGDKNKQMTVDKIDNNFASNKKIKNMPPNAPKHSATGHNVIFVSTYKELRLALGKVKAGQTIYLKEGTVFTLTDFGLYLKNKHGTKDKKIIITTSPNNPAILDGGDRNRKYSYGIIVEDCDYIEISNIIIQEMKLWGIHAGSETGTVNAVRGMSNSEILNVHVQNTGSAGIRIGGNSSFVKIIGCKINGRFAGSTEDKAYNEGIYIGYGDNSFTKPDVDYTHDITIQHCDISDRYADGIDLKQGAYNLIVQYNKIHDTVVPSQGAITVLLRGGIEEHLGERDGNVLVDSNIIWNIRRDVGNTYDGSGIIVGSGNTVVTNNIVWDVDPIGSPIETYNTFHPKHTKVLIENNIFCGTNEAIEDVTDYFNPTKNATLPVITAKGNILSSAYKGSNKVVSVEEIKALIREKAPIK